MSSGKGVSAQLIKLDPENTALKISKSQNSEHKNSIQPVKSQLNANKKENQKAINLTEKIGESKLINTKSINSMLFKTSALIFELNAGLLGPLLT